MQARSSLTVLAGLVLAGCVSMTPMEAGKHLVYRETTGAPAMQIDYPTESFCRQVEAIATNGAKCQAKSLGDQLQAHATLRYDPPGMVVEAHYADLVRCHVANSRMAAGVELLKPCSAKQSGSASR
jgi:hypothetical protein